MTFIQRRLNVDATGTVSASTSVLALRQKEG